MKLFGKKVSFVYIFICQYGYNFRHHGAIFCDFGAVSCHYLHDRVQRDLTKNGETKNCPNSFSHNFCH